MVHEGPDDAMMVSYMGILLSESQYNDMVTWMNKEYPVTLTDDLGQASLRSRFCPLLLKFVTGTC